MAEALRPLTGMNAKQLDRAGRRMKLDAGAQRECTRLDRVIPQLEVIDRTANEQDRADAQRSLLHERQTYRVLGC